MKLSISDWIRKYNDGTLGPEDTPPVTFPPTIGRLLGFHLVELGEKTATIELKTDMTKHANPMGTLHGGVIGDIADAAIGTAHFTTLGDGETFTTVDLKINFFRPVWSDTLRAKAHPVQNGRTVSYYTCDVTRADGKLVAVATSTVMTLRGKDAVGR